MSQSDVRFEEHYVVQYPPTDVVYSVRREILLRSLQVATNSLSMGVTLREALAAVYTLLDDLREDRVRVQTETKVDQGSVHTAQLTSNVKALWEQAAQHTKAKMKESEFEAIVAYLKLKAGMVVSPKKTPLLTQLALFAKVLRKVAEPGGEQIGGGGDSSAEEIGEWEGSAAACAPSSSDTRAHSARVPQGLDSGSERRVEGSVVESSGRERW